MEVPSARTKSLVSVGAGFTGLYFGGGLVGVIVGAGMVGVASCNGAGMFSAVSLLVKPKEFTFVCLAVAYLGCPATASKK
jgi:hypothetical protein